MKDSYDAVIIGSGPAGCAAATSFARAGYATLVLERLTPAVLAQSDFAGSAATSAVWRMGSRVVNVQLRKARPAEVWYERDGSTLSRVEGTIVVDASGREAALSKSLGLNRRRVHSKKAAVWGHYRGVARHGGTGSAIPLIFRSRGTCSWFWFIRLDDDITSIGVVGDCDYLLNNCGDPERIFEDELVQCPELADRLMNARLVGGFRCVKQLPYSTVQNAGDGWVLVGDAWGYIDPIYLSSGVLAAESGMLAANAAIEGLRGGDTSAAQLSKWTSHFHVGLPWIRRLVTAFGAAELQVATLRRELRSLVARISVTRPANSIDVAATLRRTERLL